MLTNQQATTSRKIAWLILSLWAPALTWGEDSSHSPSPSDLLQEKSAGFTKALDFVATAGERVKEELQSALEMQQSLEEGERQLISIDNQLNTLQQAAGEVSRAGQEALSSPAMQPGAGEAPAGGGEGGGGGGEGGGGGGGAGEGLQAMEPPKLEAAPPFEMPAPIAEASPMGGPEPRGATGGFGSNLDLSNAFGGLTPNNLQNTNSNLSPAAIAAGNMPDLSGPKQALSPAQPPSTGFNDALAGAGAGAGGMGGGMMGGMGMGGNPGGFSGGGGATDGSSMASVGQSDSGWDGAAPKVYTTEAGASSGGGASSDSSGPGTGSEVDEAAVLAQASYALASPPSAGAVESGPGRGLMAWVGWAGRACRNPVERALMAVCEAGPRGITAVAQVLPKPRLRAPASTDAFDPVQASSGVYRKVRAGLLGLVSGK